VSGREAHVWQSPTKRDFVINTMIYMIKDELFSLDGRSSYCCIYCSSYPSAQCSDSVSSRSEAQRPCKSKYRRRFYLFDVKRSACPHVGHTHFIWCHSERHCWCERWVLQPTALQPGIKAPFSSGLKMLKQMSHRGGV